MAIEEQTSYNVDIIISGAARVRAGQKLTITNRTVTKLAFVLHKSGSPTGNVTFEIRKVSGDTLIMSKVWGTADNLQTDGNEQLEEVEFDTPTFINEEVRAVVYYPADVSNYRVEQHYQNTDVKGAEEQTFWQSGDWVDSPTADCAYKYTYNEGGSTTPVVTTQAATDVIATGATGHGNVQGLGSSAVTQHGHVWSTSQNPTTADSKTELGAKPQTGAFTSLITGLTPGVTYYIKAYATNSSGTAYGSQVSIGTASTIQRAHIWSEGSEFHYFDEAGVERVLQGHGVASDKDLWPWLDPFS